MTLARRTFLRLAAGAAALPAVPRVARANAYPSRPVRIIVGFASGSSSDIVARLIAQALSDRLGQPFVVENRTGAGTTLAAEAVVRAAPDGYTLLFCGSPDTITATLYDKLSYNFVRDTAPIASIDRGPLVLVAHPAFAGKSVPELIAYAKANPGKVNFGSAGVGTVAHMAGEMFAAMAGIDMVHVPYRGLAPALNDLIGGQLHVIFATVPPAISHIRAGKLRALARTSSAGSQAMPDLPMIGDLLPGYEASTFTGLSAPTNTAAEIVEKLNTEVNAVLADAGIKARLTDLGNAPVPMAAADFGKLIADETEKWGRLIKLAGIKPE